MLDVLFLYVQSTTLTTKLLWTILWSLDNPFDLTFLVWRCLSGWAPSWLLELCHPHSTCPGRRTLRSSAQGNLVVPFARSATMQTHSYSVVGPTTWNGLPIDLWHLPNSACSQFHHLLKTAPFRLAWA